MLLWLNNKYTTTVNRGDFVPAEVRLCHCVFSRLFEYITSHEFLPHQLHIFMMRYLLSYLVALIRTTQSPQLNRQLLLNEVRCFHDYCEVRRISCPDKPGVTRE
ncbi:hypothetical protein HHI36_022296 [Cryptolaemus montrouzieri]|uniref:Uncharacterized protein n=1 Tax=Cryptolaemus montrouzieri TaxID=559131 RepID=A0ABD2N071_9CUCU